MVEVIDYEDLIQGPNEANSISEKVEKAFGVGSVGVIAISNVPGFVDRKAAFLPLAYQLARLPPAYLEEELTDEESRYNTGWSHGKEKLGDKPDFAKGSFFFNPVADVAGSDEDRAKYPLSYPRNVWPDRIPGFETAAKEMGCLMKDVAVLLSKHIDAVAAKSVPNYSPSTLHDTLKDTEKVKGRLLYYFPLDSAENEPPKEDSWIGWHNDSGFLTALAGDMYVNHETGEILSESPDPDAGLYVVNRDNEVVQIKIPRDCMAIQMGECVQILTGGAVYATPHCVRGASVPGISRISFPCFIDTPPGFPLRMPPGCTREQVLQETNRVPPLGMRWTEDGMTMGDFLNKSIAVYYDWKEDDDDTAS